MVKLDCSVIWPQSNWPAVDVHLFCYFLSPRIEALHIKSTTICTPFTWSIEACSGCGCRIAGFRKSQKLSDATYFNVQMHVFQRNFVERPLAKEHLTKVKNFTMDSLSAFSVCSQKNAKNNADLETVFSLPIFQQIAHCYCENKSSFKRTQLATMFYLNILYF